MESERLEDDVLTSVYFALGIDIPWSSLDGPYFGYRYGGPREACHSHQRVDAISPRMASVLHR